MSFPDLGKEFLLTVIPIFVAIDALGILPFVIALVEDEERPARKRTLEYALLTALVLGMGFMFIGKAVFLALNIKTGDFLVAGGLLLLVLSIRDIATGKFVETPGGKGETILGVVPIGTPLVVGPAVLTTLLSLIDRFSLFVIFVSFIVNLAITWQIFVQAERLQKLLGHAGLRAVSKIASLLLAAIAVKMIRQGLVGFLGG